MSEKNIIPYNTAFFGLFENVFIVLRKYFKEEKTLIFFKEIMEKGLASAYGNKFKKGSSSEFVRLVGERDENVGLKIEFPVVKENKIIYRFITDPFPNLKGLVSKYKLDSTYMDFKVNTILGKNWNYITTRHLWEGDDFTEHVITKN